METLSAKQKSIVSKNNITVEKSSNQNGVYVYLIAGCYYQQKGFGTEYEAFCEGISKVLKKK